MRRVGFGAAWPDPPQQFGGEMGGWDHPEPRSANTATLRITENTEVSIMPRPVTDDGRGWKVFVQHKDYPLTRRIMFADNIEQVKLYISRHPEQFS